MGQERYVVRDEDGCIWYSMRPGGPLSIDDIDSNDRCERTNRELATRRDVALAVLKLLRARPNYNYWGPFKLKRLVGAKPKPKAPREVFVALCDGAPYAVDTVNEFRLGSHERVVRYVLAEGEE